MSRGSRASTLGDEDDDDDDLQLMEDGAPELELARMENGTGGVDCIGRPGGPRTRQDSDQSAEWRAPNPHPEVVYLLDGLLHMKRVSSKVAASNFAPVALGSQVLVPSVSGGKLVQAVVTDAFRDRLRVQYFRLRASAGRIRAP